MNEFSCRSTSSSWWLSDNLFAISYYRTHISSKQDVAVINILQKHQRPLLLLFQCPQTKETIVQQYKNINWILAAHLPGPFAPTGSQNQMKATHIGYTVRTKYAGYFY